jgi:hypothetical protein
MRAVSVFSVSSVFVLSVFSALSVGAQVVVRLPDGADRTVSVAQLSTLPRVSGTATAHGTTFRYEGVDLRDVLRAGGFTQIDSLRGPQLRRVLLVVGADGYAAAIALADLDPSIGGRKGFLVDREDGAALPPDRGPYRVIIEGDGRPSRWVRQVARLEIVDMR